AAGRRAWRPVRAGAAWLADARAGAAGAALGGLDQRHDVLQELPGHVGVRVCEVAEVPERDLEHTQVARRGHGCRPLPLADQGDLPEVVAGAERLHVVAADADRRRSLGDDEEADSAHLTLTGQDRPGLNLPLAEVARE